ncbi:hypothetical protein [Streptomyces canus]|uniref:hypothetical protein n=1 Tax=Streptomyces canus TaxID=58343 RepID=UPI0030E5C05F
MGAVVYGGQSHHGGDEEDGRGDRRAGVHAGGDGLIYGCAGGGGDAVCGELVGAGPR